MAANAYPELPVVSYMKTQVPMSEVIEYITSLPAISAEVKRSTYIFFRIESENGKRGINNNYAGLQADSGRWPSALDHLIVGTVVLNENGTGRQRRFLALRDYKASLDFSSGRLMSRGLFVGGFAHKIAKMLVSSPEDLARVYKKEWVKGDPHAEPTSIELRNFLSMYNQAAKLF